MEGSVAEDLGAPESWEADESMSRLMLEDAKKDTKLLQQTRQKQEFLQSPAREVFGTPSTVPGSGSGSGGGHVGEMMSVEDAVNQVDQFLREALQNPRERLSVLRMEQDIEKFIRDPTQQQFEFQQLPTSYQRLAAHRVAQHYSLQSMVLLDNSSADGSSSRIIVSKTSESRIPAIRLADVPVSLPSEDSEVVKVAIKQRPQKQSQIVNNLGSNSLKANSSKSVEERKEEYNRARARIFNSSSFSGAVSGKADGEVRAQDSSQHGSLGVSKAEDRILDISSGRGVIESAPSSSRMTRTNAEREPIGRYKPSNRVAIFRDREVDRKDPDYDRSYDRYMQRFDPGFGFNSGPYTIQPLYAPALNYNTEFPQLGSSHRPQISTEQQPHPIPQHIPAPWSAPSTPAGIGYGHPETLVPPFGPNHLVARSASAIYLHSQYPGQHPGIPYIHHHEHVLPFSQADASFGLARPR